ncbi:CAP domain-containing protein [Cellulomonas sp. NS3]|uniref:CAP domain-containing protein n=1 Tax=Cellulomonas sp. NS3 TaxID=2973977 RepID=UPI0021627CA4|nr:CAP domain-containing protein [Cellulomonas sp. NS3]
MIAPALPGPTHAADPSRRARTWIARLGLVAAALALLTTGIAVPPSAVERASAATAEGSVYQPVTPRRVMSFAPMGPASTRTLRISGVPAGATAVALNVTATQVRGTASTYVSACAAGTPLATCRATSAFNPVAGEDTPAAVLVALGGPAGDEVTFYNNTGSLLLIADLHGFYVSAATGTGAQYSPVTPRRVLSSHAMGPGQAHTLTLPDAPPGATAVAVNLTSTGASTTSFVSACPAGQPLAECSTSSTLNPFPGRDLTNFAVVRLGGPSADQITLYNNAGTMRLIADVTGYFTTDEAAPDAGRYVPVPPARVLSFAPFGAGQATVLTLPDVPAGATAVAMNVTAAGTSQPTFVSTCPGGTPLSTCTQTSSLNPRPGVDGANNVMLRLGGPYRNQVTLYNNAGSTRLIADLQGYFVGDPSVAVPTPPPSPTPTPAPTPPPVPGVPAPGSPEAYIVSRVNQVRAENGLAPLQYRARLGEVAEAWTVSMATSKVLSHNPQVGTQIEPGWSSWGENVGYAGGYGDNAERIFTSWMNSAGHRANILNPGFTSIGVGAALDSRGYLWSTQNFATYR